MIQDRFFGHIRVVMNATRTAARQTRVRRSIRHTPTGSGLLIAGFAVVLITVLVFWMWFQ
ncbi:MAG: hypothetical protein OXU68_11515 [Bacteroidota bacterium]|nr:hypothetical protein [Bacteroidota bacterium]MDE2957617.1 hypothetical protein [Bacteroidota bacterium]